ncbi:MAG: hypothetical protein JXA79_00285 [Deltaproteobacteria bacterium]|nr:hypothetical protein [Deltaproteobacteria bacterium]
MSKEKKNLTLPIIAIFISSISLLVSIRSCSLAEKKMKLHLEPELTCILDERPQRDHFLLFTLKNEGTIDATNISVDHCTLRYSKEEQKIRIGGYDGGKVLDYNEPGKNWIFKDILRPNQKISKSTGEFALRDPEKAIDVLSFDISFYRDEDGKKYNKQCIYFVEGLSIKTASQFKSHPDYKQVISETFRFLRQHQTMESPSTEKKQ